MKKTITLLAICLAASVQAASFQWKITGASFGGQTFGATGSDLVSASATAYLVFLGDSSDVSSLFSIDYEKPGTITPAKSVSNKATGSGRTAGAVTMTYNDATSSGGDGSQVAIGNYFAAYLVYNDGKDTWYNFTTEAQSITADATGAFEAKTFSFNYETQTTIESAGKTPSGWTKINIVPEPSTAMLALAGLALLIKRRRA